MAGFEPATSWSQTRRDTGLRYIPSYSKLLPFCYLSVCIEPQCPLVIFVLSAERVGFEPTVQCNPYDDLANRSFRPLRHLSFAALLIRGCKNTIQQPNAQI